MSVLTGALGILASELVPSRDITLPSPAYRKLVACALLYKVCFVAIKEQVILPYMIGRNNI